jgi:hypothetical protein
MNREEREEHEEHEKHIDQVREIRELVGGILGNDKYNLGAVMSALVNMLVLTALDQAKMPPETLISIVAQAVCASVEADKEQLEEERKEAKWLN